MPYVCDQLYSKSRYCYDFTSISFSPEVKVLTALACSYVAGNMLN